MTWMHARALEELLLGVVPADSRAWIGAPENEILEIERRSGCVLPDSYRWFMRVMGRSMGALELVNMDLSAGQVLGFYQSLAAEDRDSSIVYLGGSGSSAEMPSVLFLDLEVCKDGDAMVLLEDGQQTIPTFFNLRTMLGWQATLRFRIYQATKSCKGMFFFEQEEDLFTGLQACGFAPTVAVDAFAGVWSGPGLDLIYDRQIEEEPKPWFVFRLGGTDEAEMRTFLGRLASEFEIEVQIDQWGPPLSP